jgi:cbb3-type cytochrome oxidase subunit 3
MIIIYLIATAFICDLSLLFVYLVFVLYSQQNKVSKQSATKGKIILKHSALKGTECAKPLK